MGALATSAFLGNGRAKASDEEVLQLRKELATDSSRGLVPMVFDQPVLVVDRGPLGDDLSQVLGVLEAADREELCCG
jgi:hypothetical protein